MTIGPQGMPGARLQTETLAELNLGVTHGPE